MLPQSLFFSGYQLPCLYYYSVVVACIAGTYLVWFLFVVEIQQHKSYEVKDRRGGKRIL